MHLAALKGIHSTYVKSNVTIICEYMQPMEISLYNQNNFSLENRRFVFSIWSPAVLDIIDDISAIVSSSVIFG